MNNDLISRSALLEKEGGQLIRKIMKYLALALCVLAIAAGMHLFGWRGLALVVLAESAFAVWMGADLAERERRMAEEIYRAILDEIEAAMEDNDD